MFVWEAQNGLVRVSCKIQIGFSFISNRHISFIQRKLDGHLGDVYSVKLFPSGVVVLSSGADMRMKIWSAENGSCPVTLAGHSSAVTDTAIIDRGMNVASVSK